MKKSIMLGAVILGIIAIGGSVLGTNLSALRLNENCKISIETKREVLDKKVEEGTITEQAANEIIEKIENCDGTGTAKIGQGYNICFGQKTNQCGNAGNANCNGNGQGRGYGAGARACRMGQ